MKITKYHNLQIEVEQDPGQDIVNHLKNTILGTPGRLLYRITGIERKIRLLGTSYFLVLRKFNRLLGTAGIVLRTTYCKEKVYNSWYIRYFSIRAPLRAKTYKQTDYDSKFASKDNILRIALKDYFNEPNRLLGKKPSPNQKTFIYGYIERENIKSGIFSDQMGFQKIRSIGTIFFSRLNPKIHPGVLRIKEKEKTAMLKLLKKFYSGYNMFTEQYLFYDNNYYLLKLEDEIIAAVQANPETWEIKEKPGFSGKILLEVIPRIPGISKIFNPQNFRFVAMEGIYHKEGYERYLLPLFETVCALTKTNFALIWLDTDSPIIKTIDELGHQGLLSKIIRRVEADISVKFINLSEEEKNSFRNNPAYISCFDVT